MPAAQQNPPAPVGGESGLKSHPPGLTTLFFTEMWERFSYYGMRSILVLFMVAPAIQGGLGFDTRQAASLYGTYTMAVYLLSVPGGFIADRFLGARRAVLAGGVAIACGQFAMAVHTLPFFYGGLSLIAVGTGLLKPNISTMVGALYRKEDPRRDSGFSIFYMGINVGAVMAPLVCGWLAESAAFKQWLSARGFDPAQSWHWGFASAGVGMLLGLAVLLIHWNRLPGTGERKAGAAKAAETHAPWTPGDTGRVMAIGILFAFTILFWAAYEQKGASLNLFAKQLVRTQLFGWEFPASWLQSLTPFYVILLAPVFARMWIRLGDRQPSGSRKFALGLLSIGCAMCLLVPASAMTADSKISPMWLAAVYLLDVIGELCLSPVGLSMVTKLSPPQVVGLMMGAWFFATSLGNKLAGYISGFFVANDPGALMTMYGGIGVTLLVASAVLAWAAPKIEGMAGR
ncbi:MAG: peptide MFS transporter [Bryobacterales bacterium]|nr:peptide MFS transporter [Bryobacterales bacterium]